MLTFDPNGGQVFPQVKSLMLGGKYGDLPVPTRDGFTFSGWFDSAEGGNEITPDTPVPTTTTLTIYAHWLGEEYKVKIDAKGGSFEGETERSVWVEAPYGDLPVPEKEGFEFLGWFTEADAESGRPEAEVKSDTCVTIAADHTVFAKWKAGEGKVHFVPCGGQIDKEEMTVEYQGTYAGMPTPVRPGYEFTGWMTEETGGIKYTPDEKVVSIEDLTLYAGWKECTYTVHFNTCGVDIQVPDKEVSYNAPYGELPSPEKEGMTFLGWYTSDYDKFTEEEKEAKEKNSEAESEASAEGEEKNEPVRILADTVVTLYEDHTLYARWDASRFIVTFTAEDGEPESKEVVVTFGKPYGKFPEFKKEGYEVEGWYRDTARTKLVTPETIYDIPTESNLYVKWKLKPYKLYFNAGAGTVTPEYIELLNDGTRYGELPIPELEGHEFLGWYTTRVGGTKVSEDDTLPEPKDQMIYAKYQTSSLTLTFNPGAGKCDIESKPIVFERIFGTLPEATLEGYEFAGWADENGNEINGDMTVKKAESLTVYAVWDPKQFTVSFESGIEQTPDNLKVKYGEPFGMLPEMSLPGDTFVGWFTAEGKKVTEETKVDFLGDIVLYGKWEWKYSAETPKPSIREGALVPYGAKLSLTTATNGAEIYYTTDPEIGEFVTKRTGKKYLDAIRLLESGTLYAIAVKPHYMDSEVMKLTYTVIDGSLDWGDITMRDVLKMGFVSVEDIPMGIWMTGVSDQECTGKPITFPDLHIYNTKVMLREGIDYTIKYKKNVKVGTAVIHIAGKKNYVGNKDVFFKIFRPDLREGSETEVLWKLEQAKKAALDEMLNESEEAMNGIHGGKKDGPARSEGPAQTISPEDYQAPSLVYGMGIESVDIRIRDIIYRNKPGICKPSMQLIASTGQTLKSSDYEAPGEYRYAKDVEVQQYLGKKKKETMFVSRTQGDVVDPLDIIPVGTEIECTVTGKNKYFGSKNVVFRYVTGNIEAAQVKISDRAYIGVPIEPTKDDMVVKLGKETLGKSDYEIIGYRTNTDVGNAYIELHGIGNYGGYLTVKFGIHKVSMKDLIT